jgi:hypothetical protein
MMTDMTLERLRAHRNNIHRYQRLLATRLSDLEQAYAGPTLRLARMRRPLRAWVAERKEPIRLMRVLPPT